MKKILAIAALLVVILSGKAFACDSLDGCLSQIPFIAGPGEGIGKSEDALATEIRKYGKDAIPGLLKYLESDNHNVRKLAAYTLGCIDGLKEDDLPVLIKAYNADTSWVARAIARVGTDKAARFIVTEMKKEKWIGAVDTGAISILGHKAVPYLLEDYSCSQDCNENHMRLIGDMFGELGEDASIAVPELIAIAEDYSKDIVVRDGALYALDKIGKVAKDAVPGLTAMASDPSQALSLRESAIRALGQIGEVAKDSIPALKVITSGNDEKLAGVAKDAIVRMGGNDAFNVLIQQLNDDEKIFDSLVELAYLGDAAVTAGDAVKSKLNSQNHYIRIYSARTLGFIGNKEAVPALCEVLKLDSDWLEVAVACESIGRLKAASAIPVLENVRDNYWYPTTRNEADKAINVILGEDSYPPVETDENSFFYAYSPVRPWKYKLESCTPIDYPLEPKDDSLKFYSKDNEPLAEEYKYKITYPRTPYYMDGVYQPAREKSREVTPTVGLNVGFGWLLGRDTGEFGGELVFWESKDKYTIISEENVGDLFLTSEGVIADAGLSHMGIENNFLYKVVRQADGTWKPIIYKYLPGYTRESSMLADGRLLLKTQRGTILFSPKTGKFEMAECKK